MDVKKIEEKNGKLVLLVKDSDTTFMNSLRRSIMSAIPIFAVDHIQVFENNSVMPDEMLAHRLAMVPLIVKEKKTKLGDEVILTLDKEGPATVYGSDIQSKSAGVEVAQPQVPLVKLGKGQKIRLEIYAKAGTGKQHAKWQPALVSYKQLSNVTFANAKNPDNLVKIFPPGTVEVKAKKLFVTDPIRHRISREAQDRHPDEVDIHFDDTQFVLTVESYQNKSNADIVSEGINALRTKTEEFKAALKNL